MLLFYIWPEDFPRLALHCLSHDVPEAWTGDIPAPMLRHMGQSRREVEVAENALNISLGLPPVRGLPDLDARKVRFCDRLDLYLWCREQSLMGNTFVDEVILELLEYFEGDALPDEHSRQVAQRLRFAEVSPRTAGVLG